MRYVLMTAIAVFALCCVACAAGEVVWKIGEFDEKYSEFAIAGDYGSYTAKFAKDVAFRVGKDDPAVSWSFIQPGPIDAWAGSKLHPFAVIFDLPGEPRGTFTLKVDLVGMQSSRPSTLGIDINGHKGSVMLPSVDCTDAVLVDASKGKQSVVELALPAATLVRGENRLVLTTDKGSWVIYDALSLSNDASEAASVPSVKQLEIKPTIRFVRRDSKLMQVLEVRAQFSPGAPAVEVNARVGDKTTREALHPDLFGLASGEIYVDEVTAPVDATVSIDLGGKVTTASCKIRPERHWNVYVQASTHVDIGYTDYQPKIKTLHNELMSNAMALCKQYPGFKWNSETAWVIDNYISMMPKADVDAYMKLARERRVGSQAVYGHMLTENLSHEEMIRDMYFAKSVSRKYGVPCDYAVSCDVPTYSGSLPTVLAQSGIKYFSAGLNLYRAHSYSRLFDRSPFYWEGPDGSRVLTWWGSGYAIAGGLGLTASVETAADNLERHLRYYDRPSYPSDAVLVFGAFGDNNPNAPLADLARVAQEWNAKYAYPKIIFCLGPEFFQYLEATCKDKIQVMKGDGGCYWEDGAGSSALETGLNRCAKEDLSVSEKLYSFTSAMGGTEYPQAALDSAWKNAVLYDEHTWGAYCSFTDPTCSLTLGQWRYKSEFAHEAKRVSDDILARGLSNLGKLVGARQPSVVVFNPHSWPASGLARATMADGKTVDIWADGVPAMGYKTISLTAAKPPASTPAKTLVENRYYLMQLDPTTGAVKSLYDKELGRDLVDSKSRYGLNQYIYIAGYAPDGFKDVTRDGVPPVKMMRETLPYGTVVKIKGSAYKTPEWTSEITLYNDAKRIDFSNVVCKNETTDREAGYFAFPFAVANPAFCLSQPNGVLDPAKDMLDGACMQWYCAQDYVAVNGDGCSVVWSAVDAPLVTLCDINRETFKSPIPITNGHLYSYAFNNYWDTNYRASQGGPMQFRFSLTSAKQYDPIAATRFGQMVRSPLVGAECRKASSRVGRSTASLVSVSPSNVVVQAIKRAEAGGGYIVRLREVGSKKAQAKVELRIGKLREAWSCSLLEDKQKKLRVSKGSVTVTLPANALTTILFK